MNGPDYYIPAVGLGCALAFKLPSLLRARHDPLLRSVCALLANASAVFFFAAPPTIEQVNRVTGITNVSAPLVYCLLSAFSASCLVLIVNWRGGPAEVTRRVSRRWIVGYTAVIVAITVLFLLGDTPTERLRDLDTYYARTPYVREMIVLYLAALTVAGVAMTVLCLRWSLRVSGWLRTGLVVIVIGYVFNLAYLATKFTAVFARWAGGDLDGLSTNAAPVLASVGALISAVGFCLPLVGRRLTDQWGTWATYRRLGPLWRELRSVSPYGVRPVRMSWWTSAELLVTRREADIHDGLLSLHPYFDARVRADAYKAAVTGGGGPVGARAVADAVMVTAAVRARGADPEGAALQVAGASAPNIPSGEEPRDLVGMSLALSRSPVVAAARAAAAAPSGSGTHEPTR
ncbi:MAB_1171c family putative transporter [Streptomyces sp. NPDC091292]|uniref:MAB_1171c family putative transporter n=1 Tax=Streptomyces sp. NPDC091292 TaxID=3365991 RepID=UPI00381B82F0